MKSFCLGVLLEVILLSSAHSFAQEAAAPTENTKPETDVKIEYSEPDASMLIFDMGKLGLTQAARKSMATLLANYVSNARPITKEQCDINTKCLLIAFNLDPDNKTAFAANFYLKNGKEPQQVVPAQKTKDAWKMIVAIAQKNTESGNEKENFRLLANLGEIMQKVFPKEVDGSFLMELAKKKGVTPSWIAVEQSEKGNDKKGAKLVPSKMEKAPDDAPGRVTITRGVRQGYKNATRNLKFDQQKIKGLSVIEISEGKYAGIAMEMIATVEDSSDAESNGKVDFTSDKIGDIMKKGLQEAAKAVGQRYPYWGQGKQVSISFNNQYVLRDGPSASVAQSVLLLSLLDGFKCSEDIAITGDISADWKVRAVGGVPGKIRGAIKQDIKMVAIPQSTLTQVQDWLVIETDYTVPLSQIQIFTADTLEEVVELARTDRTEDLETSIREMEEIQKGLKFQKYVPRSGDEKYRAALEKVVKRTPNLFNAKYLLDVENNENPTKLSLDGTASRLMQIGEPFFSWLKNDAKSRGSYHFSSEIYSKALMDLNDLQSKMDPRGIELKEKLYQMIELWRDADNAATGGASNYRQVKELNSSIANVRSSIKLLFSNEKNAEEMMATE